MFVSDLRHYLDLPVEAPRPARRMAEHLGFIVRAGTAGEVGSAWVSALTCPRRPARTACPGHITVLRGGVEGPIRWGCNSCGDEGVISGWEDSPFDLRLRRPRALSGERLSVEVAPEVAATLRELVFLDPDCERAVFSAEASANGVVLRCDEDGLEELVGFVAAEANHEQNRRRQRRFDDAFAVLSEAAGTV